MLTRTNTATLTAAAAATKPLSLGMTQITDGTSQPITAAGAVAPATGLAIAGMAAGGVGLQIEIVNFSTTAGVGHVRIVAEDSVDAFTGKIPVCEWSFEVTQPGAQGALSHVTESYAAAEVPGLRAGTASAVVRANVVEIDGTGASLTFNLRTI